MKNFFYQRLKYVILPYKRAVTVRGVYTLKGLVIMRGFFSPRLSFIIVCDIKIQLDQQYPVYFELYI